MNDFLEMIKKRDQAIFRLEEIQALLGWDQETGMPEQAVEDRSDQMSWIQQQISDRIIDPAWESLLRQLSEKGKSLEEKAWHRNLLRRYTQNKCLPEEFMSEFIRITSLSRDAWIQARKADDFSIFQPHLEKVVEMVRKRAELTGFEDEPYNALLDLYEPGMTASKLEKIFRPLQDALIPLIDDVVSHQTPAPEKDVLYNAEKQKQLHLQLIERMGYDLSRGRLDFSIHPFTTTTGSKDVRITTHLSESDMFNGLYSTMHEAGHGMYEQNLPSEWARTMLGQAGSLGIHESQSRFWENIIGRSRTFWDYMFPLLREAFPEQAKNKDPLFFFRESNRVRRSLIRTESDEYTYNLHIILRFNLERMIVNGEAEVADLPGLWIEETKRLIGVEPQTLAEGALQDIHWSLGDWGYFPTYTLGNLYSAQIWHALKKDQPGVEEKVGEGRFEGILEWLVSHVHSRGSILSPEELITEISGETLNSRYFIEYLSGKSKELYAD